MAHFSDDNLEVLHKFGRNADVDTGGAEDIWDGGGAYAFPAAAAETTIVSDSADDAAAGTGAKTVTVIGLDSNYGEITETVTLAGATPVTLTNQFLRVHRAYVATAGSGGVNAGNVQVKHGSTVITQITATYGQTLMAVYTVPADYQSAWLQGFYITIGKATTTIALMALQTRSYGGAWLTKELVSVNNSTDHQYAYPSLVQVTPRTDIRMRALSVTANNTDICAGFDLLMRRTS